MTSSRMCSLATGGSCMPIMWGVWIISLSDPARRPAHPIRFGLGGRKSEKNWLREKDPLSLDQNFFSPCTFPLCTTTATNHGSLDQPTPVNSAGALDVRTDPRRRAPLSREQEGRHSPQLSSDAFVIRRRRHAGGVSAGFPGRPGTSHWLTRTTATACSRPPTGSY